MKLLKTISALITLCAVLSTLFSCGGGCDHVYANDSQWIPTKPATCFEDGSAYNTCIKCGEKVTLPIMMLEHDFETPTIYHPTCTEEGKMVTTCVHCGMKVTSDKKPATGHNMTDVEAKEPTCTDYGYDEHEKCVLCDYSTMEKKPALGHLYVDGVCDRCGEIQPEEN